ncbi:MAG: 4Fe-4S cluster-binding domain-containing protein, partial [Cetobacterium sp.]
MSNQGIVFNIQRFTMHDGPGIRTELFLKGCPLKCDWCGNPESLKRYREPGVFTSKCISEDKCGSCKDVCPDKTMLKFQN